MPSDIHKNVVMPKKISRDYKTKKRNVWKTKSAKRNSDEKRVVNNVYIGAGNAQRWIVLKKKLDYSSDKDFVTYLLDLADPHARLSNSEAKPARPNKEDDALNEQKDTLECEETNDSCPGSPSASPGVSPREIASDDGEWRPVGPEEPLRRSPRKPSSLRIHVRRSSRAHTSDKKTSKHRKKKRKNKNKFAPDEDDVAETRMKQDLCGEGPPTLEAELADQETNSIAHAMDRGSECEMPNLETDQMQPGVPQHERLPELRVVVADYKPSSVLVMADESSPVAAHVTSPSDEVTTSDDVHIEVGERVKLKHREKHRRSSASEEQAADKGAGGKHGGKHKRKKHKHGDHETKRKHHDIRKAPQDGLTTPRPSSPPLAPSTPPPPPPSPPAPHRVAIKIKLCCNCNSRHLQDACPLLTPSEIITDAIPLAAWDLAKVTAGRGVHTKTEMDDQVSQSGSTTLDPDDPDEGLEGEPTYAMASLPRGFSLRVIDVEHGFSVIAQAQLPQYAQLGPLVGQPIKEMDIPDDFNMKDIWEATASATSDRLYISTVDPDLSNWLRYLRPAPTRDQRNLVPVVRDGQLLFYTLVVVGEGEELLYWADHSPTWSKKKMEKTNCGGCNLRFTHPLYYRLHCAVFHDPNFSLTIRKYHCKVCGAAVLGKENIMRHASEQHQGKGAYRCQFCNKFFLRLNYLEMHRTYGCAANPQRTRPLCDFCGRKFCQPQKLKVHIKRMHSGSQDEYASNSSSRG